MTTTPVIGYPGSTLAAAAEQVGGAVFVAALRDYRVYPVVAADRAVAGVLLARDERDAARAERNFRLR
ncbi:hypothetical protein AB0L63_29465 [Nocardia sp. NPDC051990]|uniref:hypothetical protein n=1 Tax=Nocardia sp. NPDC051990 TaxID=3155285 RepID=UPI0034146685